MEEMKSTHSLSNVLFFRFIQPIAVFVEDAADIAAFENFSAADIAGDVPAPAAAEPAKEETKSEAPAPVAESKSEATPSHGGRVLASPLARVSLKYKIDEFMYTNLKIENC